MRRSCFSAFVLALAVFAPFTLPVWAAPQAGQQQPPPVPTFRAAVALVPIDVAATDRAGKPVLDLKREDFTILEDGVPQEIRHFALQRLTAQAPDPSRPVLRPVPTLELAPQNARTFLIMLGRGRLQEPSKGLDGLLDFLRNGLLPQDRVAVMGYNHVTDFTTEHARIAQVVERFRASNDRIETDTREWFSGLRAIYGTGEIPPHIQKETDAVFEPVASLVTRAVPTPNRTRRTPGLVPSVPAVDLARRAGITGGAEVAPTGGRAAQPAEGGNTGAPSPNEGPQRADGTTAGSSAPGEALPSEEAFNAAAAGGIQTSQDVSHIFAGIQALRYLPGEKHLIYVTASGMYLPNLESDRGLAAMASSARVAIHVIQTGGMIGPDQRFTLRTLAEQTGGYASLEKYAKPGFERINATTQAHYLLGYYPADANWNGRYRRITVKVNRPDVTLSFRHGYYGRATPPPIDAPAFLAYTRVAAAGGAETDVHDLAVKVKVVDVAGTRDRDLVVTIDASRIQFEAVEDRHVAKLQVVVFYGSSKGASLGERWQVMDLKLKEETYQKMLRDGIPYTTRIPSNLKQLRYAKIVVYDYGADLVGSLTKDLW